MKKFSHIVWWLAATSVLFGQDDLFFHPELTWMTIETPHFLVHYQNGTERMAREAAAIAEKVYAPITQLYRHEPDSRVSIVIKDFDDYSNGAAYFYDNKIEIWAPALDFELRGTHPWLRDVITHEFTHIVQIQTAMKLGRKVPAVYFQWLGYEAERRPDILYGFPNIVVSYPLSAFVVPSWFAEGAAQYNHPEFEYDYWDSHRDMILRLYMLDGNPLSWEEMAVFGKTSLGNESSYNAGFSIVQYISETYGLDKLREISGRLTTLPRVTIDGAVQSALGKAGRELYEEWKQAKTDHYRRQVEGIRGTLREGESIEKEGFGNFYPAFSPDGKTIAYISNKGEDYFSLSSIYLYDVQKKVTQKVKKGVRSTISFSPDGRKLYYAKATRSNAHWSKFYDVYEYDLQSKKETRLTRGLRASNPKISPDGSTIVYAVGGGGTSNIGLADADGSNPRQLTSFTKGEQVFTPVWSPDGETIAFGFSDGQKQSVAMLRSDGNGLRIVASGSDCRTPSFSPDGKSLYYASDETGIFNIYALDIAAGLKKQITNVLGGAFLPTVSQEGALAYATYTSTGYKIAMMSERSSLLAVTRDLASLPYASPLTAGGTRIRQEADQEYRPERDAGSTSQAEPEFQSRPYRNVFTSVSLIPLLRVDNYNPSNKGIEIVKPGLYFTSSDMLDKLSLLGGAAVNLRLERDLFLIFEYRDKIPLLYQLGIEPAVSLELYNITRKTDVSFPLYTNRLNTIKTDVTYNLFEFDVTLRQPILSENTDLKLGYALSRYNADIGSFFVPDVGVSPAFGNLYLIGNVFSAQFRHQGIHPTVESAINPKGRTVALRYSFETNKFNPDGEFDVVNGVLVPQYTRPSFHRIELQWAEHFGLPIKHHTLSLSMHGGSIIRKKVDDFFDFYGGGFIGMKGYPYYAIGGNQLTTFNLTYRFPLWHNINTRILQFYFTKLYGSLFGDIGNAWTGAAPPLKQWKTDVGFELRLEAFSFYQYPTRFFFSGAYGFNRFDRVINNIDVTYGREWRFYFGVLFGFELSELTRWRW